MPLIYIKICGRLSYLLLLSKTLILVFIGSNALGKWVSTEGEYFIDREISRADACHKATINAKRNALIREFGENISSLQIDVCSEYKHKSNCSLYQSTFDFIDGGLITDMKNIEEKFIYEEPYNKCLIKLDTYIVQYKEKPDINFTLSVKLNNKLKLYEGNKISISGEVSKNSHIIILGWYPDINKDKYFKIFPNQFDENNYVKNHFNVPSKEKNSNFELVSKFPHNLKKKETQEFLVVVASKVKIEILEEQDKVDFYKRLINLGRSNWDMKILGYTIMKD